MPSLARISAARSAARARGYAVLPVAREAVLDPGGFHLSGPDRALAGTSLPDLANRGGRPPSPQMVQTTTRRVAKPVNQSTKLSVEVIRGNKQEVLSY